MEGTYPRERRAIFAPSTIPESGRHPGFRECVTLRGVTQEREPWSAHEDGGSIQPAARRIDDTQGCSRSSVRRGTFTYVVSTPVMRRSKRRQGGSFAQGLLGPCSPALSSQRPSPQTMVGPKRRPQAALRSGGGFRGLVLRRSCNAVGPASEGLFTARSSRDPSSRGEGRQAQKALARTSANSSAPRESGVRRNARIGCSGV